MTAKTEQRIKNWLTITGQTIPIVIFLITLLYFPVKAQFEAVETRMNLLEKQHEKHCADQKERLKEYARLEITNVKLEQVCKDLTALFRDIEKCQEKNEQLNNSISELLSRFPKN